MTTMLATQLTPEILKRTDEPLQLSDRRITGEVDIRHRTVQRPLLFDRCHFESTFDCRNTHFSSTVSMRNCVFSRDYNSGDNSFSHAIYDSDLDLHGSKFEAAALFIGSRCKGATSLRQCNFTAAAMLYPAAGIFNVNFAGADFDKALFADGAKFLGPTNFNGIKCGHGGFFLGTQFHCEDTPVNFVASSFGLACDFQGALFRGGADLAGMKVGLFLNLEVANFSGIDKTLDFTSITTPYIHAGGLRAASRIFLGSLSCDGEALLTYRALECGTDDLADGPVSTATAAALKEAFSHLNVELSHQLRSKPISKFFSVSDEASGRSYLIEPGSEKSFVHCWLEGGINIDHSRLGRSLDLTSTLSTKPVDLEATRIAGDLKLGRAELEQGIVLTSCHIHRLRLEGGNPLRGRRSRMRGVEIEEFPAGEQSVDSIPWLAIAYEQDPKQFSRDFYVTFERSLRAMGETRLADDVYYESRVHERTTAEKPDTSVRWSTLDKTKDLLARGMTGYGVRLDRLFYYIAFFLVVGIFVFTPVGESRRSTLTGGDSATQHAVTEGDEEAAILRTLRSLSYRTGYTIDEFVPVVNLHLAENWKARTDFQAFYRAVHVTAGWILVPVAFGALSGLFKKR